MALRKKRAPSIDAFSVARPQLLLARIFLTMETRLRIFALPLAVAIAFVALAWLGVFTRLYPWGHLAALVLFTVVFFDALGRARSLWRKPSESMARRRVEAGSGLDHRPLDVLQDRPFAAAADEANDLWQAHVAQARQRLTALRWPKSQFDFAAYDPYGLRYILVVLAMIGAVAGWGALGGRMIAAINPALGRQLAMFNPTLDAWITPPEYTGLPPIMIATPAGMRHDGETIDVPEGSTLSAHLMEPDGDAPVLLTGDRKIAFDNDAHGDFAVAAAVDASGTLAIRRGWQTIGSWKIRMVADQPPQISLSEPPAVTERKSVKLAYEASDDYGVTAVAVRIAPRQSLPGASNDPVELPLANPMSKYVKRAGFVDLTATMWAGTPVRMTLIATDAAGHRGESKPVDFTLPERVFVNPVARILIDARKKLQLYADNESQRNDIANVMAGVAHQPASYNGDPVVLMALRAGAVRLVLDHSQEATNEVSAILWQTAVRIEDGTTGLAERNLREAQKDLADALDRNAGEKEIQQLIDRLHQALAQYLSELATRMAAQPAAPDGLNALSGPPTKRITPQDLQRMLERLRDLSASGSREAARQELARLQQILENIRTRPRAPLSAEQKQMLQELAALRAVERKQQELLDKTFHAAQSGSPGKSGESSGLAQQQSDLQKALQQLMQAMKPDGANSAEDQGEDLGPVNAAMQGASERLQQGNARGAMPRQNEALQGLEKAVQALAQNLRNSMGPSGSEQEDGMEEDDDPLGRQADRLRDGDVKVPDQMEVRRVREILDELQRRSGDMERSKTERDYIDRLLQDF